MLKLLHRRATLAACATVVLGLMLAVVGCSDSDQSATTAVGGAPGTMSDATPSSGSGSLLMYAGSASKPPTEEAIQVFEKKTGIRIEAVFGGSGTVLSQMKLAKEGDLYFPGSSDFMEKAKKEGDVISDTEEKIVYLVPAINVQEGNPKSVQGLKDLTKPGIKVAIANPETVCVGLYAVEIIEQDFSADEKAAFRANLLNYTESCEKTATVIALKQVDAVLGWSVFENWNPEAIQTIPLDITQIPRVGYIPIAVSSYTRNQEAAQQFIDFLTGEEGQAIFAKYGYFATPEEAFDYIGEEKPVGGEYPLPADWVTE